MFYYPGFKKTKCDFWCKNEMQQNIEKATQKKWLLSCSNVILLCFVSKLNIYAAAHNIVPYVGHLKC